MKLTSKGRYAVTAILDLAMHGRDGPVVWLKFPIAQVFPYPT